MKQALIFFLLFILNIVSLSGEQKTVMRVGHFPTITHAQGLAGHHFSREGKGWFEKFLGPDVEVQWFIYNDGPTAMEAIFAHSIDMTYVGPSPSITAYLKSEGEEIRIVCGACIGGAALVVKPERIQNIEDFKGKKIATPQFGNTQDVAARAWFLSKGYHVTITGGDLMIVPMANSFSYALFKKGDIDGVWTIEPWISRLVLEADAQVFLNESSLWPETQGKYVTTHLVSSSKFLKDHPDLVKKWVAAHVNLTDWMNSHPDEAKKIVNQELKKEVMRELSEPVLNRAWNHIVLTYDPVPLSLFKSAEDAFKVGFIKQKPDLNGIYDLNFLNAILNKKRVQHDR